MPDDLMYFNGIDAGSGGYSMPPITPELLSDLIQGQSVDPARMQELQNWHQKQSSGHYGLKEGLDPTKIDQSGWGVVFPSEIDPAIVDALRPLIEWRREQVGKNNERFHRVFRGGQGVRPDDTKEKWLTRHGASSGPVDPLDVPYYLLLVGDPEQIPYAFQNQLDVQYAVGRICFDQPEEYAAYAASVVEAEKRQLRLPRRAAFFGVSHRDDPATNRSADDMVRPLYDLFTAEAAAAQNGWQFDLALKEDATKQQLARWMGGQDTPALLYTAGHGLSFGKDDPGQRDGQGALLCHEFPGPAHWPGKPIPPEVYFSGQDLAPTDNLWGLVAFFFACYGAGTPRQDDFAQKSFSSSGLGARALPAAIAPHPFVARLPQRMLSHPRGSALAVIGHVERTWGYSFISSRDRRQLAVFESTLKRMLNGHPVGSAFEYFNMRYAELASDLFAELNQIDAGKTANPYLLSSMWTASNDARNYVVLGDPAVRLMVANKDEPDPPGHGSISSPQAEPHSAWSPQHEPASALNSLLADDILAELLAEAGGAELAGAAHDQAVDFGALQPPATPEPAAPNAGAGREQTHQPLPFEQLRPELEKLRQLLAHVALDPAPLRVSTWLCADLAAMQLLEDDPAGARLSNAHLRAVSYLKENGEILTALPEDPGPLDDALLVLHAEMVKQAQSTRAALLQAVLESLKA